MAEDREILTDLKFRFHERQVDFRETTGAVSGRGELTVEQILAWADAHHAAHGVWPEVGLRSGLLPVDGVPGESWKAINHALALGLRGLPGDSSLAELLAEQRETAAPEMSAGALAKKIWAWEQEQFPLKGPRGARRVQRSCPPLTIDQILAWADAHHAATGAWPRHDSGLVRAASVNVSWNAVSQALSKGRHGLPGGSSLARLLAEHRGVRSRRTRRALTVDQILAWADAHQAIHGRWPSADSGPVTSAADETWGAIDAALAKGCRGFQGGLSLSRLLAQHRGYRRWSRLPGVTVDQILAWADAHHAVAGHWPTKKSGPVTAAPGESWNSLDSALEKGLRGLSRGSSLCRLLAERRGQRNNGSLPRLTVDEILAWADAHHAAHGRWPMKKSGPVATAPGERWAAIDSALASGNRGLSPGSSLRRLLAEHRGYRHIAELPRLTVDEILAWADAHHAAHGRWPVIESGTVAAAPGETWRSLDQAMRRGKRWFGARTSLAGVLAEHRGHRNHAALPRLTIDQILAWADAYHAAHGRWPTAASGPVAAAPGETWKGLDQSLTKGRRGLKGGTTLARLLAAHRQSRGRPELTC